MSRALWWSSGEGAVSYEQGSPVQAKVDSAQAEQEEEERGIKNHIVSF